MDVVEVMALVVAAVMVVVVVVVVIAGGGEWRRGRRSDTYSIRKQRSVGWWRNMNKGGGREGRTVSTQKR